MSDELSVSRRESLRNLGLIGVAIAVDPAATLKGAAQTPPAPNPSKDQPALPAANAVDLAVARMSKGHA